MIPVIDLIEDNLIDAIHSITSLVYETSPIVERLNEENQDFNRWRDRLVLVWKGDEEEDEAPLGYQAYWQNFNVLCVLIESERSTLPMDRRINLALADVEKALSLDRSRGGLAIWTKFESPVISGRGTARATVLVKPKVRYRTALNSRYVPQS